MSPPKEERRANDSLMLQMLGDVRADVRQTNASMNEMRVEFNGHISKLSEDIRDLHVRVNKSDQDCEAIDKRLRPLETMKARIIAFVAGIGLFGTSPLWLKKLLSLLRDII